MILIFTHPSEITSAVLANQGLIERILKLPNSDLPREARHLEVPNGDGGY